jgi:ubiquinone/menaquinone biosynthesis C-methylase UbiE
MGPTAGEIAMAEHQIRFVDGAAYEQMMGRWSRIAGDIFLDWLAPARGLRWLDVGCGSGAFTERLSERCAPATLDGIDPAEAQLTFARARPEMSAARFRQGDAMALPFADDSFDAATMALVIFFVPEPAKGVAEMGRRARRPHRRLCLGHAGRRICARRAAGRCRRYGHHPAAAAERCCFDN